MSTIETARPDLAQIEQRILGYLASQGTQAAEGVPAGSVAIADGGLDSLGIVQLSVFVGDEFGIGLEDEDFVAENFETVGSLARLVESRLAG